MKHDHALGSAVRPVQVLIVEDEPADVALWRYAFRDSGIMANVTFAHDGAAALAAVASAQTDYDLVLLDLNLPKVGGKEVLQAMRGSWRFDAIPIVVLSAARSDTEIAECYRLGASTYVEKPSSYPELVAIVRQLSDGALSR